MLDLARIDILLVVETADATGLLVDCSIAFVAAFVAVYVQFEEWRV